MTSFGLYNERMVSELRKIAWASFFCFPFESAYFYNCIYCIYPTVSVFIYAARSIYKETGTNGKTATSICLLQTKMAKFRLFTAYENGSLFSSVAK
jgi:hypothetical protein